MDVAVGVRLLLYFPRTFTSEKMDESPRFMVAVMVLVAVVTVVVVVVGRHCHHQDILQIENNTLPRLLLVVLGQHLPPRFQHCVPPTILHILHEVPTVWSHSSCTLRVSLRSSFVDRADVLRRPRNQDTWGPFPNKGPGSKPNTTQTNETPGA